MNIKQQLINQIVYALEVNNNCIYWVVLFCFLFVFVFVFIFYLFLIV